MTATLEPTAGPASATELDSSGDETSVTLALNEAGWIRNSAKLTGGIYADKTIAGPLNINGSTVYRVRTGKLAPGPLFIAAALSTFGPDKFGELFVIVRQRAA
jgi:hypothetical protein